MLIREKTVAITCLFLYLSTYPTTAIAESRPPQNDNTAAVTLAVDVAGKKIELSYQFRFPVRAFQFRYKAEMLRKDSWDVRGANIRLEDDKIYHAEDGLIETVTIEVGVDAGWFDRVYPSLRPVGDSGLVFFTDYAMLDNVELSEIRISVQPGNIVAYSNFVSAGEVEGISLPGMSRDTAHQVLLLLAMNFALSGPPWLPHSKIKEESMAWLIFSQRLARKKNT